MFIIKLILIQIGKRIDLDWAFKTSNAVLEQTSSERLIRRKFHNIKKNLVFAYVRLEINSCNQSEPTLLTNLEF